MYSTWHCGLDVVRVGEPPFLQLDVVQPVALSLKPDPDPGPCGQRGLEHDQEAAVVLEERDVFR